MSSENTSNTFAAHVAVWNDQHRVDGVGIWNLHVMIYQEGNAWIAQGLEVDYVAQGKSAAEVKYRFQDGFLSTINEHLRMYKGIEKFLVEPPKDVLLEMELKSEQPVHYTHVSLHVETMKLPAKIHFFTELKNAA